MLPLPPCPFGQLHHPAARVLARGGKLNRAALFQHFERGVPEFQVQDFAFAREQVVVDAEAVERAQVAEDDRGGHHFRHLRGFAVAFFDFLQRLAAQFEPRFVFREELRHARVEVPAEIVEARRGGQPAHFVERFRLEVQKPSTTSATCTPVLSM